MCPPPHSKPLSMFCSYYVFFHSGLVYNITSPQDILYYYEYILFRRSLVRAKFMSRIYIKKEKDNIVEWWKPLMVESRNIFLSLIPVINKHNLPLHLVNARHFHCDFVVNVIMVVVVMVVVVRMRCVFFVAQNLFVRRAFIYSVKWRQCKTFGRKNVSVRMSWE